MIEVFKTSISNKMQCEAIRQEIQKLYPELKIDFDLEDIDNILRVENFYFDANKIVELLFLNVLQCKILE